MRLEITEEQLAAMVARRVAELLTPDLIARLARERVDERIGLLTLEEALRPMQSANVRQLRDKCAKYGIPIVKLGNKTEGLRLRDIEAAHERFALREAPRPSRRGRAPVVLAAAA